MNPNVVQCLPGYVAGGRSTTKRRAYWVVSLVWPLANAQDLWCKVHLRLGLN